MTKRIGRVAIPLLLLAGLSWQALFLKVGVERLPVSSDESHTILQAEQIAQGERPLLFLGQPYMFPLESYLNAPFVRALERTAAGARTIGFVLGLLTYGLWIAILCRLGPFHKIWPAWLLATFPSAYLLTHASAFALPGYSSLLFLSTVAAWAILPSEPVGGLSGWRAAAAGVAAGLAVSVLLVALPVAVMTAVLLLWNSLRARRWGPAAAGAMGLLLGLLPFLAVCWMMPGSHDAVTGRYGLGDLLGRLWPMAVQKTLPVALGFMPTLFPDSDILQLPRNLVLALVSVWTAVQLLAAWAWLRPRPNEADGDGGARAFLCLLLGVVSLALVAFLFSRRGASGEFRYLILTAWALPMTVAAALVSGPGRRFRIVLSALAVTLALVQAVRGAHLLRAWETTDLRKRVGIPAVDPVLSELKTLGIRHAVAPWGSAARISFFSYGDVTASQVRNDRFPGWPVPFQDEVYAASNVAFVLSQRHGRLTPLEFEEHLASMDASWQSVTAGEYIVYHAFRSSHTREAQEESIQPAGLRAFTSHNAADAHRLLDDTPLFWRCAGATQQTGMWIRLEWDASILLHAVELDGGAFPEDHPHRVSLQVLRDGRWVEAGSDLPSRPRPFQWRNKQPHYARYAALLALDPPQRAQGVRVEITAPRREFAWTLSRIRLFGRPDSERGQ